MHSLAILPMLLRKSSSNRRNASLESLLLPRRDKSVEKIPHEGNAGILVDPHVAAGNA